METTSAAAARLRGIWLGVADLSRSRRFYERLGARFDQVHPVDGMLYANLGGTRLILEAGLTNARNCGPVLLFDVPDTDALHTDLTNAGSDVERPPKNEPWGRQFNVRDPDGHLIAFIGPVR
jgi:predicted enzyme related to lactoylglutathione lyase